MNMATMRITDGTGVQFTFDNGITISVQIGGGTYSDNYREPIGRFDRPDGYVLPPSSAAEIAVWDQSGSWFGQIDGSGSGVRGYVPVEDVLRFTEFLRSLPNDLTSDEIEIACRAFNWHCAERAEA